MICPGLLRGLLQKEKKKKSGVFLPGCIQRLNAACQKWRFITSPKETTFSRWWKHDCPDVRSAVTVITLGARRCPTPPEKRGATCQQKTRFQGKGLKSVRAEHPVHHSEVLWMATKASKTLAGGGGGFNVAKSECFIDLPSIKQKTRKSLPHSEKYQQNWRIKATFMGTQSNRSWMLEG